MKRYIFIAALMIGLFSINSLPAQVHVNINVNTQPAWGPSGYDYARYYFIPEINVYYDINSGMYIYFNGKNWIKRHSLPPRYRNYDLYRSYKVVINARNPWYKHNTYKKKYAKYGNMHGKQVPLRDSRDHNSKGNKNNGNHSNNSQNNGHNNSQSNSHNNNQNSGSNQNQNNQKNKH